MNSFIFSPVVVSVKTVFTRYLPIAALILSIVSSLTATANTSVSENAATDVNDIASDTESDTKSDVEWSDAAVSHHIDADNYKGILDHEQLKELAQAGSELFSARFTVVDGVGRPLATQAIIPTKRKRPPRSEFARTAGLDANACVSCHNQPVAGGAGDFSVNVFVSEGFQLSDFDSTDPQFSNERNTNHLFGAGLVELLAREMTADLHNIRRMALSDARSQGEMVKASLVTKGISFGQVTAFADGRIDTSDFEGVDDDLIVKPFSQKGVMTSLRQFTVNALNHHHGMQANERFGERWTGTSDFDEDGVTSEMTAGDVSALVAYQANLPPPSHRKVSDNWAQASAHGSQLFDQLGCNQCHVRALPLNSLSFIDPGPYDAAGTLRSGESGRDAVYDLSQLAWAESLERNDKGQWMVPLFGDLKRHVIADTQVARLGNELLSQRFVERNEFMTAELWGIGSTDPYGHRGDISTLGEVIAAHGGEARESRDLYLKLSDTDRSAINAFLKMMIIEPSVQ